MWRLPLLLICLRAWAGTCEDIAKLKIPFAAIDHVENVLSGTFSPGTSAPIGNLPPFCRIAITSRPSADSEIAIEIWMPEKDWNGHFEGTGNGGFAGRISYSALANGVTLGYAVANTDMGMATPLKADASIFVNRPERWADWGYRATHEMTVVAKQVVKAYYAQPLKQSYFTGCSTGGEQALMEAERFPEDYDGIVGGAPAHNRTGVHMSILWNFAAVEKDPAAYIPPAKLSLLSNAVVSACDELDGLKDGVISDPSQCRFDPAALQCAGAETAACLTRAQVETVRKVYAGPANPRTRESIYPGLPRGSEFGWERLGPAPSLAAEPPYAPIFKWAFGPQWDWRSFDFDGAASQFQVKLAKTLNAASTNLDGFRKRGGKLMLYHGWADWLVAPGETIRYYNSLPVHDSVRLFMVPGMAHCGGGPGADRFDVLGALARWVETGTPPEKLAASKLSEGKPIMQRVLCPYPQVAAYSGGSYTCVKH